MRAPRATTRVAGLIGHPIGHSLSPVLHNAAFEAMAIDWVYVAFPAPPGAAAAAVAAVRTMGIGGLSVTMPHKADVAKAVDRLTPVAAALGVANTVVVEGDELVGDSTDGPGLLDALAAEAGWDSAGRRCVVLGAGGTARAVALSLGAAGAADVAVVARRADAAAACAALAGRAGRAGTIGEIDGAELVVNATPVGMHGTEGDGELPLGADPARMGPGQLVVDVIYAPPVTPLLAAAARRGATTVNGLGMLVHQAARQIRAWTGIQPPVEVMTEAGRRALAG